MPKVDGWSVISSLKANPQLAEIPVIMQSVRDDRDLGFMLGASEYLVKPVERKTLLQILKKYTNAAESYILIVDDDESTRRLLARTLKREGWNTVEVDGGAQGLIEIERKPPVLIILDLMMPDMDGFEFLQTLRSKSSVIDIPVVVLTSKDLTSQDRLKLNGGVERILEKGRLNRDRFLDEVKRTVHSLTNSHSLR
jgi:CheY-like chemotaxis protein